MVKGSSAVVDGGHAAMALTPDLRVPFCAQVLYLRNFIVPPQKELTYVTGLSATLKAHTLKVSCAGHLLCSSGQVSSLL